MRRKESAGRKSAGGGLEHFLPFIVIPLFFLLAVSTMFRRKKKRRPAPEIELHWSEMNFFERHGMSSVGRIEAALHMGSEKLGLPNAIVTLQLAGNCCVQNVTSLDGSGDRFVVGQVLPRSLLFCGMLSLERASLSVDYAGISDWHSHPAHAELGWEAYIGVRRELSTGEGLTIAFYHQQPREALFSAAEKRLVGQLGDWVAAILERERGFAADSKSGYQDAVARA
jgi:hypothetical protein